MSRLPCRGFPVLEVLSAMHIMDELALDLGEVLHDDLEGAWHHGTR